MRLWIAAGVVILLALLLAPVLKRAYRAANKDVSPAFMSEMGKSMLGYASEHQQLFPAHVRDLGSRQTPSSSRPDVSYMYIPGSTSADSGNVVLFEIVPASEGGNVLLASGSVEFMDPAVLQSALKQTEAALTAKHIPFKCEPATWAENSSGDK